MGLLTRRNKRKQLTKEELLLLDIDSISKEFARLVKKPVEPPKKCKEYDMYPNGLTVIYN